MDNEPALIVASVWMAVHIGESRSLKDKRAIVKSVLALARNRFNASAAEVGAQTLWQRAELGFAICSGSESFAREQIQKLVEALYDDLRFEVLEYGVEIKGIEYIDPLRRGR